MKLLHMLTSALSPGRVVNLFKRAKVRAGNRYTPHQSTRERTRRLRQITEGKLTGHRGFIPPETYVAAERLTAFAKHRIAA
jgi:hypothetical protein